MARKSIINKVLLLMREMIHGVILIYYVKTSKEKYFDDLDIFRVCMALETISEKAMLTWFNNDEFILNYMELTNDFEIF